MSHSILNSVKKYTFPKTYIFTFCERVSLKRKSSGIDIRHFYTDLESREFLMCLGCGIGLSTMSSNVMWCVIH